MSKDRDVVVTTRIRLARSMHGMPFPIKMNDSQHEDINKKVLSVLSDEDFEEIHIGDLSAVDRRILVESHIASPQFVEKNPAMLLLNRKQGISVMVGEEDHIRLQCILFGENIRKANETTTLVDKKLSKIGYAFNEKLGHLTSAPTNIGTGMRCSLMLHLPVLASKNQIESIARSISKFGYTIRGYYGEGSKPIGDMFQLSNEITLGVTKSEIMEGLQQLSRTIIDSEFQHRNQIMNAARTQFSDRLYRSYGMLKYARVISSNEMMEYLSNLRLALSLGLIEGITNEDIEKLAVDLQVATLMKATDESSAHEVSITRADIIRHALKNTREKD